MSKVLIIEDDPMVALINRRYLERIGGMTIFGPLADEKEIMALLEKEEIDLILLDMYLPKKNGLELLQKIRGAQYIMDVIMITAANTAMEIKRAYAYGVLDYLVKPFEFERFEKAIEKHKNRKDCFRNKESFSQGDIDRQNGQEDSLYQQLPKGLNKRTLERITAFLKEDREKVWTLRELAKAMDISNVTIKKYMDHLEEKEIVSVNLTSGQVGRPEHQYRLV